MHILYGTGQCLQLFRAAVASDSNSPCLRKVGSFVKVRQALQLSLAVADTTAIASIVCGRDQDPGQVLRLSLRPSA